jgi:hypothetical protein
MDLDPAIFVRKLQNVHKKLIFFPKFFCLFLFESLFTSFFKDKKSLRSHKTVGIDVFLTNLLDDRRFGSGAGSVSLTNGSGFRSGRPKNVRTIRIRIRNTARTYTASHIHTTGIPSPTYLMWASRLLWNSAISDSLNSDSTAGWIQDHNSRTINNNKNKTDGGYRTST